MFPTILNGRAQPRALMLVGVLLWGHWFLQDGRLTSWWPHSASDALATHSASEHTPTSIDQELASAFPEAGAAPASTSTARLAPR